VLGENFKTKGSTHHLMRLVQLLKTATTSHYREVFFARENLHF
jgi:hypothetical protein